MDQLTRKIDGQDAVASGGHQGPFPLADDEPGIGVVGIG